MLFGMYAPVPHVTVGSKEITRSVKGALDPLPAGEIDPAFTLAKDVLCAADQAGFDLCLYAERHLGADFEAWILAAAISSWTRNIRAMPAVHPGLWHPTLIAKMTSCLDRLTTGRSAINLVTGWNEVGWKRTLLAAAAAIAAADTFRKSRRLSVGSASKSA